MKLQKVDESYLKDEVYEPWPELSEEERNEMEKRYMELLPKYKYRGEKLINNGSCKSAMDVLHDAMLKGSKTKAISLQRTEITKSIREVQKRDEYMYQVPTTTTTTTTTTTDQISDEIDLKTYMENNRNTLSKLFKLNF